MSEGGREGGSDYEGVSDYEGDSERRAARDDPFWAGGCLTNGYSITNGHINLKLL